MDDAASCTIFLCQNTLHEHCIRKWFQDYWEVKRETWMTQMDDSSVFKIHSMNIVHFQPPAPFLPAGLLIWPRVVQRGISSLCMPTLSIKFVTATTLQVPYLWSEIQWKIHENRIVLSNGKVMHHDGVWYCYWYWVMHDTILGNYSVSDIWWCMWIAKCKHLACMEGLCELKGTLPLPWLTKFLLWGCLYQWMDQP